MSTGVTLDRALSKAAGSVERRNRIAHRGEKVTHQDAVTSVDACEQHVLYLMRKVEGLLRDFRSVDYSGSMPKTLSSPP